MIKSDLGYLLKYHRINWSKTLISLSCLVICYLAISLILSFATIFESKAQFTFNKYFSNAAYILSPPGGIKFSENGQLSYNKQIDDKLFRKLTTSFPKGTYNLLSKDSGPPSYVSFTSEVSAKSISDFAKENDVNKSAGYYQKDTSRSVLFDIKGASNRFNVFSFQNQLTAFYLGEVMASELGVISREIFFLSLIFTWYVAILFHSERKNEISIFVLQGNTDIAFRIIFIDCLLMNYIAFAGSLVLQIFGVLLIAKGDVALEVWFYGGLYLVPYSFLLIIVQLLILFNQVISYGETIR